MSTLRDGTGGPPSTMRVLSLDEEAAAVLEGFGYVTVVPTVEAALEELTDGRFDCLLIDASSPEGVGRLERLRDEGASVPTVAFCGSDAAARTALDAGATDVVRIDSPSEGTVVGELAAVLDRRDRDEADRHGAIADLSRRALEGASLDALLERAAALVADALGVDYCGAFELTSTGTLVLREGVGWEPEAVGGLTIEADERSQAGYALRSDEPVVAGLGTEDRFGRAEPLVSRGAESGISVVVDVESPWGVLGAYATDRRTFTGSDVSFVRGVADVLGGAVERDRDDRHRLDTELEEVYGRVTDAFVALDGEARVTHLNAHAEELLGVPRERLVGTVIWEPFPDAFEETFRDDYREAMERQEPIERERYYPFLDRWYEGRAYPSESGLSVYFRDITERREHERELERYETIVETVNDGIYVLDEGGHFTTVNDAYVEMTGYDRDELVGAHCSLVVGEEVSTAAMDRYTDIVAGGDDYAVIEAEIHRADGDALTAESTFTALTSDGEIDGAVGVVRDTSDRRERERALRAERDLVQRIVETSPVGIVTLNADGAFDLVNGRAEEILGYPRDDLEAFAGSTDHLDPVGPDGDPLTPEEIPTHRVLGENETFHGLEMGLKPPGRDRVWLSVSGTPLYDENGTTTGGVITFADVTDRKEHERELERYREYTDDVLDAVDDVFYVLDDEGRVQRWNASLSEATGYSESEIGSMHALEFFDEHDREAIANAIRTGFETGHARVDAPFLTEGGESVPYEFVASTLEEPEGDRVLVGIGRDVTEREEATAELERRIDQQAAIARLGERALAIDDLDALFREATELVSSVLDTAYSKVLDLDPDAREFRIRQGVGWRDGTVGEVSVPLAEETQAGYTLLTEEPIITDDLSEETRFLGHDVLSSHGVMSGITVVIGTVEEPWGVLGVHDVERRAFDDYDASFVQSIANVLASAIDRVERERELERYGTIVETVNDGIYTIDETGRFTSVNRTYASMLGYDREELVGAHASMVVDDEVADAAREIGESMHAGETDTSSLEATMRTASGERIEAEATFALLSEDDGGYERVGVVRDITDRKRIERELRLSAETLHELYQLTIVPELPFEEKMGRVLEIGCKRLGLPYGILTHIEDGTMTIVQSHADHERLQPGESCPVSEAYCRRVLREGELVAVDDALEEGWDGDPGYERFELSTYVGGQVVVDDEVYGTICFSSREPRGEALSDVERTFVELVNGWASYELERTLNHQELERRMRQQRAIAAFGQRSLAAEDLDPLFREACETVVDVLDTEYCKVLDLDPDSRELLLRRGVGWRDGIVGNATVAVDERSQAGYTLLSEEPVIVDDLDEETRFSGPELLTSHDVVSGISVIIGPVEEPWGILGVHDVEHREFTSYDADFVQNVANVLANAIDRIERERRLERQREQLASLDQLNAAIRDITHGILETASREEIETAVCERLAGRYRFAWIGGIERGRNVVTPTVAAGVEPDYLDGIEIAIDDDDPSGRGPTGEAIRSREPQFWTDVLEDPDYEPWHETARERGYRSSAAIPIQHEDSLYGVLNVYSTCPEAFGGTERDVLTHLGEIVGHTIYAVEQRKALTSDTVTELEFRLNDMDHPMVEASSEEGVEVTSERLISASDGNAIQFATVSGMDAAEFLEAIEQDDSIERAALVSEGDEGSLLEVRTSETPITDALSGFGGRITDLVITDGAVRVMAELPPDADVRAVVTALESVSPGIELLAQRTETRDETTRQELQSVLVDRLTEKQRAALETAYFGGYFDWPRGHTGEEIAELLGLSPATLAQHLRIAERKLFEALFDGE